LIWKQVKIIIGVLAGKAKTNLSAMDLIKELVSHLIYLPLKKAAQLTYADANTPKIHLFAMAVITICN
jgi:hypothetical protein